LPFFRRRRRPHTSRITKTQKRQQQKQPRSEEMMETMLMPGV
jgi:hypothetical protein